MTFLDLYIGAIKALVIVALALGLFWFGHRTGAQGVQAQWDKAKLQQYADAQKSEQANRAKEAQLKQQVIEAQNAAQERIKTLQAAADSARTESDSLRNDLAAIRAKLPGLAADAVRQYADTASAVLDECQRDYQNMATTADRHSGDVKLLMDAWPKP